MDSYKNELLTTKYGKYDNFTKKELETIKEVSLCELVMALQIITDSMDKCDEVPHTIKTEFLYQSMLIEEMLNKQLKNEAIDALTLADISDRYLENAREASAHFLGLFWEDDKEQSIDAGIDWSTKIFKEIKSISSSKTTNDLTDLSLQKELDRVLAFEKAIAELI